MFVYLYFLKLLFFGLDFLHTINFEITSEHGIVYDRYVQ